jgi:hypothetical protein
MSHFQKRMLEIRGQVNERDLFSCSALLCACGPCAVCDQPMHSDIHQGRGRARGGQGWRHGFVASEVAA